MFKIVLILTAVISGDKAVGVAPMNFETLTACESFKASNENLAAVASYKAQIDPTKVTIENQCLSAEDVTKLINEVKSGRDGI